MSLRIRRGLDADRLTITPEEGEFVYTTDNKEVAIGDGSTAGGILLGKKSDIALKENSSNKTGTIVGNEASTTLFPTIKGIVDWVVSLFVPKTRNITINGDTKDLSTDRSWTVTASAAWGGITGSIASQTDLQTALDGKVDENAAITGATKTKITYDSKGLVTNGTDATTADINDSTDRRYVTDAEKTVIGNTSGVNTGDQTSIVGITGTKNDFNAACTNSDFIFRSDVSLKSGIVSSVSFSGNPKKATVTFSTAFDDNLYSVSVIGESSRAWSIESKTAGSFVINSNANTAPSGNIFWLATSNVEI